MLTRICQQLQLHHCKLFQTKHKQLTIKWSQNIKTIDSITITFFDHDQKTFGQTELILPWS